MRLRLVSKVKTFTQSCRRENSRRTRTSSRMSSPSSEYCFLSYLFPPFSRRVMGAWWSPRSSKPLSARLSGRGRFDSFPLRLDSSRLVGLRPEGPKVDEPTCLPRAMRAGGGRRVKSPSCFGYSNLLRVPREGCREP